MPQLDFSNPAHERENAPCEWCNAAWSEPDPIDRSRTMEHSPDCAYIQFIFSEDD